MQGLDWDDLRHLLAVSRAGSLAGAAAGLKVDATTVGRRLRAAERALGAALVERLPDGALRFTPAGEAAVREAEVAEAAIFRLSEAVAGRDAAVAGTVRVSAVPILIGRALVPSSKSLVLSNPGLKLELVAEPRGVDLIRREADVALRLARPSRDTAGDTLARRIGHLAYAVYESADAADGAEGRMPWIGYGDAMADLPHARWLTLAAKRDGAAAVSFNDAEAIVAAVRAGLGRSLLPRPIADDIFGLRRVPAPAALPPPPRREVWLLAHPESRNLARIAAVTAWLERTVRAWAPQEDGRGTP